MNARAHAPSPTHGHARSRAFGARSSIALLSILGFALGCGGAKPKVCDASAECRSGDACVIGKCASTDAGGPVTGAAHLVVLVPDQIAFVSSDGESVGAQAVLSLGASIGSEGRILLRFPKGSWPRDAVVRAYLVLDRVQGAQAGPGEVTLRASAIVAPWSTLASAGTSWASPPKAEPIATGEARVAARGTSPIRIDVTAYATQLVGNGGRPWGLRIEASGSGFGVPIATGYGGGLAPRLEVFTQ